MKLSRASGYGLHALMYMVRHATQLPVPVDTISKAEGLPVTQVFKVLRQLAQAGFVRPVQRPRKGYIFAKPPEEIPLLDLFEAIEGQPLFDDCPLRHCECAGTPKNCYIFARWVNSTKGIKKLLEETSIAAAAWNHPEHRFDAPPRKPEIRIESIVSRGKAHHTESRIPS